MPKKEDNSNLEQFRQPLSSNEITWKIQGTTKDNSKTIIVPYMDNRAVMKRLDECFGATNWRTEFKHHNYAKGEDEVKRGLGCTCVLSIKINDEWISKEDGADSTYIESFKGSISDAMKRAATQWGMGRDLYDYPKVFLKGNHKYIPNEIEPVLRKMTKKKNNGGLDKNVVVLDTNSNQKQANKRSQQSYKQNSNNTQQNTSQAKCVTEGCNNPQPPEHYKKYCPDCYSANN